MTRVTRLSSKWSWPTCSAHCHCLICFTLFWVSSSRLNLYSPWFTCWMRNDAPSTTSPCLVECFHALFLGSSQIIGYRSLVGIRALVSNGAAPNSIQIISWSTYIFSFSCGQNHWTKISPNLSNYVPYETSVQNVLLYREELGLQVY